MHITEKPRLYKDCQTFLPDFKGFDYDAFVLKIDELLEVEEEE